MEYKPSTLEKNYKFELLCEMDMGVNIDLIDPLTYKVDPKVANNVVSLPWIFIYLFLKIIHSNKN